MFGKPMRIVRKYATGKVSYVYLKPFSKEEAMNGGVQFGSMIVSQYTAMTVRAPSKEFEANWWDRIDGSENDVLWGIQPEGCNQIVGTTGIHGIKGIDNTGSTGIVIYDPTWWGKGIASLAHLGRTWFAAGELNRFTLTSTVRVPNVASRKALERVGYTVTGTEFATKYLHGEYIGTHHLLWVNPKRVNILFDEVPDILRTGLKRAEAALSLAQECVEWIGYGDWEKESEKPN